MKMKKSKKLRSSLKKSKYNQDKIYNNVDYDCPQFIPIVRNNLSDIRRMYF